MGQFRFTDGENIPVTFTLRPSSGAYRKHSFSSSKENSHSVTQWDGPGWVYRQWGRGCQARLGLILTVTGEKLAQDSHDPE